MTIGLMMIDMILDGVESIKDKRNVISSIKDRIRHRYNVSIIESGSQQKRQHAELSIAILSTNRRFAQQQLDEIERHIIEHHPGRHFCAHREYINSLEP